VHAAHAGLPIVGDNVYGREAALYITDEDLMNDKGVLRELAEEHGNLRIPLKLHAARLRLALPDQGKKWDASAPLPAHFLAALETLAVPPPPVQREASL